MLTALDLGVGAFLSRIGMMTPMLAPRMDCSVSPELQSFGIMCMDSGNSIPDA